MGNLYHQFDAKAEDIDTVRAIELIKGLTPIVTTAVVGVALGLRSDLFVQQNTWEGETAGATWEVKHRATVENELKKLSKILILNSKAIAHIAKSVFILRNKARPADFFDFIWVNFPDEFRNKVLRPGSEVEANAYEDGFVYAGSMFEVEGRIIGKIFDALYAVKQDSFGSEEIDYQFYLAINKELENAMKDETLSVHMDLTGAMVVVNKALSLFKTFVTHQTDKGELYSYYLVNTVLPKVLPPNVELTNNEKLQAVDILKGLSAWKIN